MNTIQKQHIVIVGGGFGGIKTALDLAKHSSLFEVTLISERPDFWYFPTLYHTATGGTRAQSSISIPHLLKNTNVKFIESKAVSIDRATKTLVLANDSTVSYDKLVMALGMVTNYFGIPGLQEFSYGIKSIAEAEELKQHLHKQIVDEGKPDLNYVVVGGGPTGIELAGTLGAYMQFIMKHHGVTGRKIHIDLVEGNKHLMPRMPRSVGIAIERRLRHLGVKLYLGKAVQGETADALTVSGKPIRSHTVIWTAGQANNPFFTDNNFQISEHRKVVVDEFLRTEKDIFVIGDNADTMYSGMAQTAVYDAEFVAHNFVKEAEGEPKLAYRPKRPVYVTPVGARWAAVEWGKVHLYGKLGWFLREAADFVAFTDIEPIPIAALQWAHVLQEQHMCSVCGAVS
ncbi:MAG TPA: FAD-dependent oxidoreductase [Candidatus Saccharimonadia bacterium]|nr:FAD-dependent oxidoreductase [Candidatus Saccharimonadia bacterium]